MEEHITSVFTVEKYAKQKNQQSSAHCLLVYSLVYSLTLKMEEIYFTYFSETSADFHWTIHGVIPQKIRALQDTDIFRMHCL
jgi:hypothetical protein